MVTVELVYSQDCPNAAEARINLRRAFTESGLAERWTEWEASSDATPPHLRRYGSPTVLVNGHDVAGTAPGDGSSCRVYVLPAIGAALVPGLTCPACWPGYAPLLSALGLGFIPTAPYLLPLTVAFLVVALTALAFRAETRAALALGVAASVIVLVGKFVFRSNPVTYTGVGLLIAASLSIARRRGAPCSVCAPEKSARLWRATTPSSEGR